MPEILTLTKIDCEDKLGQFLDEKDYDVLVDQDTDVFSQSSPLSSARDLVFKFRKGYFNTIEQSGAYYGLKGAAKTSFNRGLAAGPRSAEATVHDSVSPQQMAVLNWLSKVEGASPPTLSELQTISARAPVQDNRGMVWLTQKKTEVGFVWDGWLERILKLDTAAIRTQANWVRNTLISDTLYANPSDSGIAGWFGRYPRIPYGRATSYTRDNWKLFQQSWPFLESLSKGFQSLLPTRFKIQQEATAKLDPHFFIPNTPFTTITVNRNFRTAAHRDAGDLATGFSNLTVVTDGKANYSGGYLVLPEIRAAVNIRPGDLLLVANHDYVHGNTPIVASENETLERISLVCYFREDMLKLGSWEYECARRDFIEGRRVNKNAPNWRPGWNGVSPNWENSTEWHDFLKSRDFKLLEQYHPEAISQSLEDLL